VHGSAERLAAEGGVRAGGGEGGIYCARNLVEPCFVKKTILLVVFERLKNSVHADFDGLVAAENTYVDHIFIIDCDFNALANECCRDRQPIVPVSLDVKADLPLLKRFEDFKQFRRHLTEAFVLFPVFPTLEKLASHSRCSVSCIRGRL